MFAVRYMALGSLSLDHYSGTFLCLLILLGLLAF